MNAILINLLARIEKIEYTNNYIFGFIYDGAVYAYETNALVTGIKLDKASSKNGGGYSVRYNPTKAEKENLIKSGICKMICSEIYFLETVKNSKYNKGEIFEKFITESKGVKWEKDNVRIDKGADIETAEGAWSVKFQKATILTESTLQRIESGM